MLHIAQPALSQQVSGLESQFGRQLLIRSKRGVVPTEARPAFPPGASRSGWHRSARARASASRCSSRRAPATPTSCSTQRELPTPLIRPPKPSSSGHHGC
ncbi:LysR family transcriptional regulator [Pseudonocardia sp. MH-G8]|uniref:LysR family transcriptional regulator n=1 Tax=Pseudonocardia sp. MH-G8 TaxID=1854588 RepID=UPI0018E98D91